MVLFAGVDLHSNNGFYGIVEQDGKRMFKKRLPNDLETVLKTLEPFREDLDSITVESTYNWYWLVDGLMEAGYRVRLANPAGLGQYNGLKFTGDESDTFFLAELSRLGILMEGYIYPKDMRGVRDLLRKRGFLVRKRTSLILSFQSLYSQYTGGKAGTRTVQLLRDEDIEELFEDESTILSAQSSIRLIHHFSDEIRIIEKAAMERAKGLPVYQKLLTVPGIGPILGMVISLETGDIGRFPKAGNFKSYCRCTDATRISNKKKKGDNNRKCGNKHLAWAFVEGAHHFHRCCPEAQKFFQRKTQKKNRALAVKALASKLAKACYFIMRDDVDFDKERMFG